MIAPGSVVASLARALRVEGGMAMQKAFSNEQLEPLIFTIRGYRVVLDSDLARVYGISTKHLNQAVRRNSTRFPHRS